MPDRIKRDFPLFPLGLVALPHELIPLHIFEQRYRTMMGECLGQEREFGIIWLSDSELKPVGCTCAIEEVLEQMEDGTMNILTRGSRPFRLIDRQEHLPYPAGTVELLADVEEERDEQIAEAAHSSYATLLERATEHHPEFEELEQLGAYEMAAMVDFGLEAKQELLELRSENARLTLLAQLFRAAARRLDFVDRAQARARSNGKVRF